MPKSRLHSVVLPVAVDVPNASAKLPKITKSSTRPRSISLQLAPGHIIPPHSRPALLILTPLTSAEEQGLWSKTAAEIAPDVLLPFPPIPLHLDSVIAFRNNCCANITAMASLAADADSLLSDVALLVQKHAQIARHTAAFDREAADLQKQELSCAENIVAINERLHHFDALESANRLLRRSGSGLVTSRPHQLRDDVLAPLSAGVAFIDQHPSIRDASMHKSRFHNTMARGLSLIRDFLLGQLRDLSQRVTRMLAAPKPMPIDVVAYAEYTSFLKADDGRFPSWTRDLAKYAALFANHTSFLEDVLSVYFSNRSTILRPHLSRAAEAVTTTTDESRSSMLRLLSHLAAFVRLVQREYALCHAFFPVMPGNVGKSQWELYAGLLLEPMHDAVRPFILRVTSVSHLCQMALLMQKYTNDEEQDYENGDLILEYNGSENSYFQAPTDHTTYGSDSATFTGESDLAGQRTLSMSALLQPVSNDIQSRLIFRIQAYVDNSLSRYVPSLHDLQLSRRRESSKASLSSLNSATVSLDADFEENLFQDVYYPLAKALTLLSNIYELVNTEVFGDLAHYIVRASVQMLSGPLHSLASAHLGAVDALLYIISLLLLLKAQVSAYDIQYARNDYSIDFTSGLAAVWQRVRHGRVSLDRHGLAELARLLAPKIVNTMIDANLEIDRELNEAVGRFDTVVSAQLCTCLQANTNALKASTEFKDNLMVQIPQLLTQIRAYVDEDEVVEYLVDAAANAIMEAYSKFYEQLISDVPAEEREGLDDVLEPDALESFMGDIIATAMRHEEQAPIEFNENVLASLDLAS